MRVGNECVGPRPDPKPPVVVNDPCARLSGAEFQRCIRGGTPNIPVDPKPPIKGPVTGGGDVRPIHPTPGTGSTGHNPDVGNGGGVKPVRPNVIIRPQIDGPKNLRDNGPSIRQPTTTVNPALPRQGVIQQLPQKHTMLR